ncbi:hypothetical protein U1Q18_008666 [Sarracenia purpurea var. burkii]
MDTEVDVDQLHKGDYSSQISVKNLDESLVVKEAKDSVTERPQPYTMTANSLWPVTPDSNRETGDFLFDFTSPLTSLSSLHKTLCFDSHPKNNSCASIDDRSPCTPMEGVFDPFAPGPDKLMLAPLSKKYMEDSRSNLVRRINFGSSVNVVQDGICETDAETISDDEILLETVYDTLLEAIVSKQTEWLLPETLPLDPVSDGLNTPSSGTRLNGIAETCPGAPVKPTRKLRNVDHGLCRKLEF